MGSSGASVGRWGVVEQVRDKGSSGAELVNNWEVR